MKLFIIELDENEKDINFRQTKDIEVEQCTTIGELSSFLYIKYDIPNESKLHFALPNNLEPLTILEPTVECSLVYHSCVSVFE